VKTISLKKVSAVAVAALAIGSFTAIAPANATEVANGAAVGGVSALTVTKVTTTPTTGANVIVKLGASFNAIPSSVSALTYKFQAALTTVPSGGSVGLTSTTAGTGATQTGTITPFVALTSTAAAGSVLTFAATANASVTGTHATQTDTTSAAQTLTNIGGYYFNPTKVGTYVITVWQDTNGTGDTPSVGEVSQTLSITVVAATGLSTSASIVRMGSVGLGVTQNSATTTLTNYTTTVDAVPRSGAKGTSAAPTNIGQVAVVLVNTDGSAAGNLHTVTADITGSGLVLCNVTDTAAAGTVRSSVYTLTGTNNVVVCHISSDGTAGPGTVTISVTDSVSETKTLLGTETFTSFGSVAKLEVSTKNYTIGKAGSTTGVASTTRVTTTEIGNAANVTASITVVSGTSTTPAFIVKATDSLGQAVTTALDPVIVSGTTTVVTGGTCVLDGGASTVSSSTNGVGFYNCSFSTSAAAASGAKSTLTIRVVDPAGDGTTYLTTTLDVTVGGSISTEVISFDKLAYATGEGMTITRTAKDSSGNPVFDGAAAPAITFSKSVGGTAPGASIYVGGTKSSTTAGVASVFAPSVAGAFTAIGTSGNTAGSALSAAASVTDANAGLLTQIDALNAKIVALNALIAKIMKKLGVK